MLEKKKRVYPQTAAAQQHHQDPCQKILAASLAIADELDITTPACRERRNGLPEAGMPVEEKTPEPESLVGLASVGSDGLGMGVMDSAAADMSGVSAILRLMARSLSSRAAATISS